MQTKCVVLALQLSRAVVPSALHYFEALDVLRVDALGDLPLEALGAASDEGVRLAGTDVHRAANTHSLHRRQVSGRPEVVRRTAFK